MRYLGDAFYWFGIMSRMSPIAYRNQPLVFHPLQSLAPTLRSNLLFALVPPFCAGRLMQDGCVIG